MFRVDASCPRIPDYQADLKGPMPYDNLQMYVIASAVTNKNEAQSHANKTLDGSTYPG